MITRCSREEHLEALTWGLGLALLTSLPYLLGYLGAPAEKYFLGFVLNAKDQNTYFMWMTQAASGDILLRNLYTSIPHEGAMFSLIFLFAGTLGRWLGSLDLAYQLLRLGAAVLLVWSLWLLVATFAAERRQRRWLFLISLFGAGLGWLWNLGRLFSGDFGEAVTDLDLLQRPFDLWVPEGYVFYSLLVMPHFSAAIALLLLTLRWAALGLYQDRLALSAAAGLMCLILSFVHPYDVLIALGLSWGVSLLHSLRSRQFQLRLWRHALLLLALAVGPILYNYWILHANPGMQAWLVQNKSASPPPLSYVTGYGLLLLGGYGYIFSRWRDWGADLEPWQWLLAWLLVLPLAVYAPIDFQRRLAIGAAVPLGIGTGLLVLGWWQQRRHRLTGKSRLILLLLVLALVTPTSAFHWLNSFRKARDFRGELFADRPLVELLGRLGGEADRRDGTLLASFDTGNLVPRFSGLATVIGSRGQTGNFDQVLAQTEDFFGNRMTEAEMSEFLRHHRVRWLLLGPNEHRPHSSALSKRLPGLGFRPAYLSPDGNISIYRLEIQKS